MGWGSGVGGSYAVIELVVLTGWKAAVTAVIRRPVCSVGGIVGRTSVGRIYIAKIDMGGTEAGRMKMRRVGSGNAGRPE